MIMRRVLVGALAVPAFLLAACGGDEPEVEEPTTSDPAVQTSAPAEDTDTATDTAEATEEPDTSSQTAAPDDSAATSAPGGEDGAEAAAVTEQFIVALATADPVLCELVINVEGTAPMSESPEEMEICEQQLVPTLEGQLSEQEASIIELVEIDGAQVDGDTARVTSDNFGDLFAAGFGDGEIVLQRFDGEWYVDLDNSFQP
jgi:hypothetical protein